MNYDQYLTTDHEGDRWISYCEAVAEAHTQDFYDVNEEWIEDNESSYNDLLNEMYGRDLDPKYVAEVIERLCSLYKLGLEYSTYLHRIHEETFYIYRFHQATNTYCKLIHSGMVFHQNNFSDEYLNLCKRYGLDPDKYETGVTKEDFMYTIRLRFSVNVESKIELPRYVKDYIVEATNRYQSERFKDDIVRRVINQIERENNPIKFNDETKALIKEIYNKLKK